MLNIPFIIDELYYFVAQFQYCLPKPFLLSKAGYYAMYWPTEKLLVDNSDHRR